MEPEETAVDRILRDLLVPSSRGNSVANVSINAGGVGVWFATSAAVFSFLAAVMLGFMYLDLRREQQRTQDHISVIYQLIPELRTMVSDELCKQGKSKCQP